MSIDASYTDNDHIHSLKDDLESILYIILYCALLWLPVTSPLALDWWLTEFFQISHFPGGGAPSKTLNALQREYTKRLKSTQSQAVLDWLNTAMDLHYHVRDRFNPGRSNPAWDDGKALEDMWKETLDKELPENDRHENPVPDMVHREQYSLHATYTTSAMSIIPFGTQDVPLPPLLPTTTERSVFQLVWYSQ